MTINITILDSEGTEIQISDVVLIEYTNPKLKYVGIVEFNEKFMQLVVSDNDDGWHPFPKHDWETVRVLGGERLIPALEKYFGKSEFKNRPAAKEFEKKINELINSLEK